MPRPQQVRQDEQALETLHQQVAILCISQQGGYCPSIRRCGYCDVPYRVIARAETVQEDQQYIGHMANVEFQKIGRENIFQCNLLCILNVVVSVPREQRRQHGAAGRALLLPAGGGDRDQALQPLPA